MTWARLKVWMDTVATLSVIGASITVMWISLAKTPEPSRPADVSPGPVTRVEAKNIVVRLPEREGTMYVPGRYAIIEFSDYQCPFSARYNETVYPEIKRALIDSTRLDYVFMNFPIQSIHPLALRAAEVAECAGAQGKFREMQELIFTNQRILREEAWTGYAQRLTLDTARFGACLKGTMAGRVKENMEDAEKAGVIATPTVAIAEVQADRTARLLTLIRGVVPFETIESEVKAVIQRKNAILFPAKPMMKNEL